MKKIFVFWLIFGLANSASSAGLANLFGTLVKKPAPTQPQPTPQPPKPPKSPTGK